MQRLELLDAFIVPLEKNKINYFITGSVASIFYGEPRLTHDIDIVIHLSVKEIHRFISIFPEKQYYCPPTEVIHIELIRHDFAHFNLIHHNTGMKADIYPDVGDDLYTWAFQHKRRVNLYGNLSLWLAPPEYVIIRKLEYFREGQSQKHINDIEKMLLQIKHELNNDFLNKELKKRSLLSLWNKLK
ncbi:MAG: hypothetical protein HY843_06180 [Bdellovibrio sp.]|nr:hypothetical protein [Bdellovibrio sp.]